VRGVFYIFLYGVGYVSHHIWAHPDSITSYFHKIRECHFSSPDTAPALQVRPSAGSQNERVRLIPALKDSNRNAKLCYSRMPSVNGWLRFYSYAAQYLASGVHSCSETTETSRHTRVVYGCLIRHIGQQNKSKRFLQVFTEL
jgi:hypothetical protein